MHNVAALILASVALAACVTPQAKGNAQGGVVTSAVGAGGQAQTAANAHCARFGKTARMGRRLETGSVMFDCVF